MKVSFDGIWEKPVTFLNDGAEQGEPVKVSDDGTVAPCSAGEGFDGVATVVRGEDAGVVLRGFVTLGYSGAAPAVGHSKLVADGSGGVKTDNGGKDYLTAAVDTAGKTVTILM